MFPGQVYRPQCRAMGPRQIVQGCIELCVLKCSIFPGRGMVFGYRKVEHLEHMKKHHPYHPGNWKPVFLGVAMRIKLDSNSTDVAEKTIYIQTNPKCQVGFDFYSLTLLQQKHQPHFGSV